jgi:hypothetical protein
MHVPSRNSAVEKRANRVEGVRVTTTCPEVIPSLILRQRAPRLRATLNSYSARHSLSTERVDEAKDFATNTRGSNLSQKCKQQVNFYCTFNCQVVGFATLGRYNNKK